MMEFALLEQFSKDETFRQFCEEEFDAKSFATRVIKSHAVSQQLSSLAQGISQLDKEINKQVSEHHEDLMSQATGIEALEGVLQVIQSRSQSLLTAVEKIRARVVEPHDKIVARTLQLRRIQETCDMLRQVIRELYLSRRLRLQLSAGSKEASKAAQSLSELEYLASKGLDLSGISVLEGERLFGKRARLEVHQMAEKMLQEAMLVQNQSQVATSLQIFFNLNLLSSTLDRFMGDCIQQVDAAVKSSLDVTSTNEKKGGPGRLSGMGNSVHMRACLWNQLEKLTDDVYATYSQTLLLQKVLLRKKDPVSHVLFIEHLRETKGEEYGDLAGEFWQGFTEALKKHLAKAAEGSLIVKQALESEYPKLLRLFTDLLSRIQSMHANQAGQSFDQSEGSKFRLEEADWMDVKAAEGPHQKLLSTFQSFENAYLSRSLSRLFDPINLVFSSSSSSSSSACLPSSSDQESIIKTMSSELMVACFDDRLNDLIAKNVCKAITMLCTKYEQQVITSEDAVKLPTSSSNESSSSSSSSSSSEITAAQERNIAIVNSLLHFHKTALKTFSSITSPPALKLLNQSLQHVTALVQSVMEPLLAVVEAAVEEVLCSMHQEDFSMRAPPGARAAPAPSQCVEGLRRLLGQLVSCFLSRVSCLDVIQPRLNQMARRVLELFVRHVSLVYPLEEAGKTVLSGDFSRVELAIKSLCDRPSDLGTSFRLVRAARPLMFQSTDLLASPTNTDILPLSTILHFLFSRGQPHLRPPYQTAGWSVGRYSKWMDDHPSEKDRLLFIKGSLQSYEQSVRSRGGKQFVPVYPLMVDLLKGVV